MLKENDGSVGVTQPSMVDGGKIDVFCSNGSKFVDEKDFYSQLLKLEDYSDNQETYFSGPAQGIINNLLDFIEYVENTPEYKKYGGNAINEYKAICNTLEKHFDGSESVLVKKYGSGWKVIFNVDEIESI